MKNKKQFSTSPINKSEEEKHKMNFYNKKLNKNNESNFLLIYLAVMEKKSNSTQKFYQNSDRDNENESNKIQFNNKRKVIINEDNNTYENNNRDK